MTNTEAIRRLTNIQRIMSVHTENDERNFAALEQAIVALKRIQLSNKKDE